MEVNFTISLPLILKDSENYHLVFSYHPVSDGLEEKNMSTCKHRVVLTKHVQVYRTFFGGLSVIKPSLLSHRGTLDVPCHTEFSCSCKEAVDNAVSRIKKGLDIESNCDIEVEFPLHIPMNCGDGFTLRCEDCKFKEYACNTFIGRRQMELIYKGKTKALYKAGDYCVMTFTDAATGSADGTFDPGQNAVVGEIAGKAAINARMSAVLFNFLEGVNVNTHINTAYFPNDKLPDNSLCVERAEVPPLEWIVRNKATGSFIRRFGAFCEEGQSFSPYLMEVTLKDDDRGDPPVTREIIVALGLMSGNDYDEAKTLVALASVSIMWWLQSHDIELIDLKLEVGKVKGKWAIVDEISLDCMRCVNKEGKNITHEMMRNILSVQTS